MGQNVIRFVIKPKWHSGFRYVGLWGKSTERVVCILQANHWIRSIDFIYEYHH